MGKGRQTGNDNLYRKKSMIIQRMPYLVRLFKELQLLNHFDVEVKCADIKGRTAFMLLDRHRIIASLSLPLNTRVPNYHSNDYD